MNKPAPLFTAKLSSDIKGKIPPYIGTLIAFAFGVSVFLGLIPFNYTLSMTPIVIGFFILETIILQFRITKDKAVLVKDNNQLFLQIWKNKALSQTIKINQIDYWWSYDFKSTTDLNEGDYYSNGNNSQLGGRGIANDILIHLEIKSTGNQIWHFKEERGNWSDPPNEWKYSAVAKEHTIKINKLQKLVEAVNRNF